jgi:hypothetical protein
MRYKRTPGLTVVVFVAPTYAWNWHLLAKDRRLLVRYLSLTDDPTANAHASMWLSVPLKAPKRRPRTDAWSTHHADAGRQTAHHPHPL